MEVELTSDQRAFARHAVETGRLRSEEDAVEEALALWEERERRRVELAGISVRRGDELGAFRLGSTVVLAFEPGKLALDGEVGQVVRFGERLGTMLGGGAA